MTTEIRSRLLIILNSEDVFIQPRLPLPQATRHESESRVVDGVVVQSEHRMSGSAREPYEWMILVDHQ